MTTIGKSTIANMKKALKNTNTPLDHISWDDYKQGLRERVNCNAEWFEKQAKKFAEDLIHYFSQRPVKQPEAFSDALATTYSQELPQIVEGLQEHLEDDLEGTDDDF